MTSFVSVSRHPLKLQQHSSRPNKAAQSDNCFRIGDSFDLPFLIIVRLSPLPNFTGTAAWHRLKYDVGCDRLLGPHNFTTLPYRWAFRRRSARRTLLRIARIHTVNLRTEAEVSLAFVPAVRGSDLFLRNSLAQRHRASGSTSYHDRLRETLQRSSRCHSLW